MASPPGAFFSRVEPLCPRYKKFAVGFFGQKRNPARAEAYAVIPWKRLHSAT